MQHDDKRWTHFNESTSLHLQTSIFACPLFSLLLSCKKASFRLITNPFTEISSLSHLPGRPAPLTPCLLHLYPQCTLSLSLILCFSLLTHSSFPKLTKLTRAKLYSQFPTLFSSSSGHRISGNAPTACISRHLFIPYVPASVPQR